MSNQEDLERYRQAALDGGADQHEADLLCSIIQGVDANARGEVDSMLRTHLGITLEELGALDVLHKNVAKSGLSVCKMWAEDGRVRAKVEDVWL